MAKIEILAWKENFVRFTGWDALATSELRKRLRAGLKAYPAEIKHLARKINDRQPVLLEQVHDEAVHGLTQILPTTGADFRVSLDRTNPARLFKNYAKR